MQLTKVPYNRKTRMEDSLQSMELKTQETLQNETPLQRFIYKKRESAIQKKDAIGGFTIEPEIENGGNISKQNGAPIFPCTNQTLQRLHLQSAVNAPVAHPFNPPINLPRTLMAETRTLMTSSSHAPLPPTRGESPQSKLMTSFLSPALSYNPPKSIFRNKEQ